MKLLSGRKLKCLFLIFSLILSVGIGYKLYFSNIDIVAKTKINYSSLILKKGETKTLYITDFKKVSWQTSNKKVATVTSKGKVTAKRTGKSTITATANKKKYKCKIEVIALNKSKKTLKVGNTYSLKVKGTSKTTKWQTSNEKVATVSKGVVTAKKKGSTNITAIVGKKKLKAQITVIASGNANPINNSNQGELKIHFLDVGQADCILIQSNGENTLIDTGNIEDRDTIVQYLKKLGVTTLHNVVLTHGHEDHIGSFQFIPQYFPIKRLFINKNSNSSNTTVYRNIMAAIQNNKISIIHPSAGDTITFGNAKAQIIGPVQYSTNDENANSISFILTHGNNKFFFGGDVTQEGETDILSVGNGNSYGHPHEQTVSRLNQANATMYRTDTMGTIICTSNGSELNWNKIGTTRNSNTSTDGGLTGEIKYIGNINSKVIHINTCASLPLEKNRVYFATLEAAIEKGYKKCQTCQK